MSFTRDSTQAEQGSVQGATHTVLLKQRWGRPSPPTPEVRLKWAEKLAGGPLGPLEVEGVAAPPAPTPRYGLRASRPALEEALRAFGFRSEDQAIEAGRASLRAARAGQRGARTAADQERSFEEGLEASSCPKQPLGL